MKKHIIISINLLVSGLIAFLVSTFFAEGAIGENYTDKTFVAPEFFIILIIWGIGAILGFIVFSKNSLKLFITSIVLMWGSLPVGYTIGMLLAIKL